MGSERVVVVSRAVAPRSDWHRIDASTADNALDTLGRLAEDTDMDSVCAVLSDGEIDFSRDCQVALVSVLVLRGVMAFETSYPQTVTRILDTHSALSAGQIEVLEA